MASPTSDAPDDYPLRARVPPSFPLPELPREATPLPVQLTVHRAVVESEATVDLEKKLDAVQPVAEPEPNESSRLQFFTDNAHSSHNDTLVADAPVVDLLYLPQLYSEHASGHLRGAGEDDTVPSHPHSRLEEPGRLTEFALKHDLDEFAQPSHADAGHATTSPSPETRGEAAAFYTSDPMDLPNPFTIYPNERTTTPDLVTSSERVTGYVVVHHDSHSSDAQSTQLTGSAPVSPRDDAAFDHREADSVAHVGAPEMEFHGDEYASTTTRAISLVSGSSATADFDVYSYGMPTSSPRSTHAVTNDVGSANGDATFLGVPQPVIEAVAAVVQDPSVQTAATAVSTIISALSAKSQEAPQYPSAAYDSAQPGEESSPAPRFPERPETVATPVTATHSQAILPPSLEMQLSNPYQYLASAPAPAPAPHTPQVAFPAPYLSLPTAGHTDVPIGMPLPTPKEVRFAEPDEVPFSTPGIPIWGSSTVRNERASVQMLHTDARDAISEPSPVSDALPSAVEGTTLSSDLAAEFVETVTEDVSILGTEAHATHVVLPEPASRRALYQDVEPEEEDVRAFPVGGDGGRPRITHIFEEPLHPEYDDDEVDHHELDDEDANEWHEDAAIDHGPPLFSTAASASEPHGQHTPSYGHGTVATLPPYATERMTSPILAYGVGPEPSGGKVAPLLRLGNTTTCTCPSDAGNRDRVVPTHDSAPAAGFTVRFDCRVSQLRTVALALVDDAYCGGNDVDVLVWKIVHVTPGGFFEDFEFTGQFGISVRKYSSMYLSRSVNRLGSLTRITNRGSTVVIHNPEHICDRSRQMRILNETDESLDVSIGVVTRDKVFQPLIRHRELPCDEELITSFGSLSLKAFFIEPGTDECSFETGQFGEVPLASMGSSMKARILKINMSEGNGKFRAIMH